MLATGSVYLVGELLAYLAERGEADSREYGRRRGDGARAMNDDGPSVLAMVGAVALIVALVILLFFAAGYGVGRVLLG